MGGKLPTLDEVRCLFLAKFQLPQFEKQGLIESRDSK